MLVTGILLDFGAQGGFRHSWWFRGSALLLLVPAALHDLAVFESHRAPLVAHAYRMLGGLGRAEDMVQEAWLRWDGRREEVDSRVHIW